MEGPPRIDTVQPIGRTRLLIRFRNGEQRILLKKLGPRRREAFIVLVLLLVLEPVCSHVGYAPDRGRGRRTRTITIHRPCPPNWGFFSRILCFRARDPKAPPTTLVPRWDGAPAFSEHSYRTFTADGVNGELLLMNNVGYDGAARAFYDRRGQWSATGALVWPPLAPGDIEPYHATRCRANYPTVMLKDRAVYFCGAAALDNWDRVKDPVADKEKMGRKWGGRWRRLFFTWTSDITREPFRDWLEVSNTMVTGGWLFPGDLWVGPDGTVHVLWFEGAVNRALRDKYFPDMRLRHALQYVRVRDGKVLLTRALVEAGEGLSGAVPGSRPRFHVTPDGRLLVCYYVSGTGAKGERVSEDRLLEILPDGTATASVRIPLQDPLVEFFTATVRGGSAPSMTLDLLGPRAGTNNAIHYAQVRLE